MKAEQGRQAISWRQFFGLLRQIRVPWGLYLVIFAVSIVVSRTTVELPMMLSETLDAITFGEFSTAMIVRYILLSLAVTVAYNLTAAMSIYANNITTRRARELSWNQILRIPLAAQQSEDELDLISRVTHDPSFISGIIDQTLRLITMTYTFVMTLRKIFQFDGDFGTAVLWTFPYLIFVALLTGPFLERAQRLVQRMQAELIGFFAEHYNKLKLVKVFSREEREDRATDAFTDRHFKSRVKRWLVDALAVPLRSSTQALLTGITLIYGGILISRGQLEAAMLVALHSYTNGMNNYFIAYINYYQTLKSVKGSVSKISRIFDADREAFAGAPARPALQTAERLELRDVGFAYDEKEVIQSVSGAIRRGSKVALLGPSGSGKTTLFNLILRLFQPRRGLFLLDDAPVSDYALGEWRHSIGYASQDPVLFHGTLRENIAYGASEPPSDAAILAAAEKAGLDIAGEFAAGLNTECGEYGALLSGGQRQRVAIARLFLQDPELLLLDEVSSALDTATATRIRRSLDRLKEGRTSIEIAHRLHELPEADTVWLMDRGRLAAQGSHETLLAESELYRALYETEREKRDALRERLNP